jgi:archaemetzincin
MDTGRHTLVRYIFLSLFLLVTGVLIWIMPGLLSPVGADSFDPVSGEIIYIQPMGHVEHDKIDIIAGILDRRFNKEVVVLPGMKLDKSFKNKERGQYDATLLRIWAMDNVPKDAFRFITVLEQDIFTGRYNFIFGQAQMPGKVSVISLNRFVSVARSLYPSEKAAYISRMEKLFIHELGHNFGLQHCPDGNCVMHFANSMAELEASSADYCPECLKKLMELSMISVLSDTGDAVIYTEPTEPTVRTGEANGYTLR